MATRLPKLVAFDLDYTLWDLWIDTHVAGPLHRNKNIVNEVLDKYNQSISFYKHVPQILHRLRTAGVIIAAASRTSAPTLARSALTLLLVPPMKGSEDGTIKAVEFFDQLEIYPGSKLTHFKKLHQKTGIPYSEMLFFDDEHRNKEVEQLGVTFCLVRNGLDDRTFERGLAEWRTRHPLETLED
ncbi:magnesium-dependent phosphatase-1 [Lentinula aciculospora]|uniref:Magnesium-dependent phosphatase-1 n=1 Tax=Lentinula aciculospora TaxID=153920 RepID=A0A9W8ZRL5_9AGAR|nr:magnesium-dependent phosphatase-1 [Lentinula aciculospora]